MNAGVPTKEPVYSTLSIEHIQNPNRLWALPVVGGTIKLLIVIPVSIWLLFVDFAAIVLSIINAFVVLFTRASTGSPAYAARCGFDAAHGQSQLLRISASAMRTLDFRSNLATIYGLSLRCRPSRTAYWRCR